MHFLAGVAFLILASRAHAAAFTVEVGSVEGPSWRADGVALTFTRPDDLQLRIGAITVGGLLLLRDLRMRCERLQAGDGARCDDAGFSATLPGSGRLAGHLQAHFDNPRHWRAHLVSTRLRATLEQRGDVLSADLASAAFSFSEPGGRYAAEKLSASVRLRWDDRRLTLAFDAAEGQAYAEPVFLDFSALPLEISATVVRSGLNWRIERLRAAQGPAGAAGTLELTGVLDSAFIPTELDARLDARDLAPLVATDVLPFLVRTRFADLAASGRLEATISMRNRALHRLAVRLDGVTLGAVAFGATLDAVSGQLHWTADPSGAATPSRLRWNGGTIRSVPLGASDVAFFTQGRGFTLTAPWRQPLLGGALTVAKFALRDLGSAQASADFDGAVEPIDVAALCKALGWPEFGGTLAGRLPGLTLRDETWSLDGALEAQAFDGHIRIANLRAVQPFGALPRLEADVQVRRLDLERVTGAFSFGRITGRLDGEVSGLRLLDWSPVAFEARLYSTPGYDGNRRISQRAIDSISRIGGGPGGIVSRGFFSLFRDFAYARLGISCVLRDGACEMDGVEPAPSAEGAQGYYLVRGRLLPRIDVVGYSRRVSWTTLIDQLQAARASDGPAVEK